MEIKDAVQGKKQAWKKYVHTKDTNDKEIYYNKLRKVKGLVRKAKQETWEAFGNELNGGI